VQLAERLGLSRPAVRAGFQYLPSKGLVVRKRGAGTLAANERIGRDVELASLYGDLAAAGLDTAPAWSPTSACCCSPRAAWCCAMSRTCARPGQLC